MNRTMLRPQNIMIGDWVNVKNYHWDGSPLAAQVDGIIKKHGTYYLQFGDALSAEIDRCEPIPLTPEILEKNFEPKGKRWYWGDEFSDINIDEFTDGLWEVTVWDVEIGMLDCKIYISYVHELQHVLELCEIDRLEVRV